MSFLLRNMARYAVRKIASDPKAREQAGRVARSFAEEARQIAGEEDRARAAGRAVRRALNRMQKPDGET